jgi:hypothetical protein
MARFNHRSWPIFFGLSGPGFRDLLDVARNLLGVLRTGSFPDGKPGLVDFLLVRIISFCAVLKNVEDILYYKIYT